MPPRSSRAGPISVVLLLLVLIGLFTNWFLGGFLGEEPVREERTTGLIEPEPTGQVLTADGSPPPVGTSVLALGPDPDPLAETTTDVGGWFRFDPLPDGTEEFLARSGPMRSRIPAGAGPVHIRLPGEIEVGGRVVDRTTGDAVVGALVRIGAHETRTGERGDFRIAGIPVPDGKIGALTVSGEGYVSLTVQPDQAFDDLFLELDRQD